MKRPFEVCDSRINSAEKVETFDASNDFLVTQLHNKKQEIKFQINRKLFCYKINEKNLKRSKLFQTQMTL